MRAVQSTQTKTVSSVDGLVITDLSFRPIAFNRGAAEILNDPAEEPSRKAGAIRFPKELAEVLASHGPACCSGASIQFRLAGDTYRCRTYLLEPCNGTLRQQMLAIHIHRERSTGTLDALNQVKDEYRLTARELEVLTGITLGLTTQQLAERMEISPRTVKSFLRLIMSKMGVTTRAAMVGKLLAHGESYDAVSK